MTAKEAKKLLPQSVVMWGNNPDDLGTVLFLTPHGLFIDWRNGQQGWIDYRNTHRIELYQPERNEL